MYANLHAYFCAYLHDTAYRMQSDLVAYYEWCFSRYITSGDVNGDGFVDVVISAPVFSSPGNYQRGRVFIIYGIHIRLSYM